MLRERRDGGRLPVDARLVAAGAALVEVGAVTADAARAVADAYSRTLQLRASADFGGSRWRGEQAQPPSAPGSALNTVLGEPADLSGEQPAIQSWAEQLTAGDPVRHHLWERVATRNDFHDPRAALEAAIEALVAVGALQPDEPVAGDTRQVAALMYRGLAPRDARVTATASMPAPWISLVTRWGSSDGHAGTVPVGKVSAPFDEVRVTVAVIDSRPQFFSADVEVVPGLRNGLPYAALDELRHITWWAVDDLGNYSLAEQGTWSPGASRAQGSLLFWPGLDPGAARIDLMPATASARAVIRVPLPWATAPSAS
jgi:hypothetical protein